MTAKSSWMAGSFAAALALGAAFGIAPAGIATADEKPGGGGDAGEAANDRGGSSQRSGYSYVRLVTGDATVNNRWNGTVDAKRNMPISAGDEIQVSDAARVEIGLADGNVFQIGGGTRAQFESLYAQQGEDDDFSAIAVRDGSVALAAIGRNEDRIPRIDTDDATIYVSPGGRVRVNVDPRRGTSVIDRSGSIEVRTRTGSHKLRGGQYLMVHGEEDSQVERGSFSRDRFDLWVADRMEAIAESTRTVSARYVDEDYASDVESLDGYGDWNYSPTYSSYVWTPHVDINWTPFGSGSWYYTPAGLTWWSSDPWGWYPHHYGNWFFDTSWNRWCWAPAAVYSPAWVYWAYSGNYVGWCPTGLYSGFGPWWNTYYRHSRPNVYLALNGTFHPRDVDFRGWNFTGANRFGGNGRADVIRGDRIAGQLGSQVAISSRPIIVTARPGEAREAIRDYIREAPRVIERASPTDSSRLAPILGHQRTLPQASIDALRDRMVVADRGRLSGSAAAEIAPRGAAIERRSVVESRTAPARVDVPTAPTAARERVTERSAPVERAPRAEDGDWRSRGRGSAPAGAAAVAPAPASRAPERLERARPESAAGDWRARRTAPADRAESGTDSGEVRRRESDWRAREGRAPEGDVPPARRVIERAVPGRRIERDPRAIDGEPRSIEPTPRREYLPAPRRSEIARPESAPAPRVESRPAPPPPRAESRPAPPPPPRSQPDSHSDKGRKD